MATYKKSLRVLIISLSIIPALVAIYLLSAWLLSQVVVNRDFKQTSDGITIYVKSNGVHTDIIVPAKTELIDWKVKLNPKDFQKGELNYVAFGFGDKGFYLNTPTWADLKYPPAYNGLFLLRRSAIHINQYNNAPSNSHYVRQIKI